MDYLDELESQSIYIIREAYHHYKNLAILWSIGKDSTALLWLVKKAFFGEVPFPVIHIDTTYKFPEMYAFRDKWAKEWNLNLIVARNEEEIKNGMNPDKGRLACCTALKTNALKMALDQYGLDAILLGIRRDEHGIRAKERFFSPRDKDFQWNFWSQPPELWDHYKSRPEDDTHLRVHPILSWREQDIWDYIRRENFPTNELYFAKEGKRYRSLGCTVCCNPVDSEAATIDDIVEELSTTTTRERAGRAQDKESSYMMQKLRSLGYM